MRIRNKLFILTGLCFASLAAMLVSASMKIDQTRVGGPLFERVASDKDLIADILPPPLFIVESYLTMHQAADLTDQAQVTELVERFAKLEQEFIARRDHWSGVMPAGALKDALLEKAALSAEKFYAAAKADMLPAIRAGKNEVAREVLDERLDPLFREHRDAVMSAVGMATSNQTFAIEQTDKQIAATYTSMYAFAAVLGVVMFGSGWFISRTITRPLQGVIGAMRDIAQGEGDLTKRLEQDRTDELGELSKWFNTFVERMHGTIVRVAGSTDAVTAAAQRIASASEQSACSLRSQSEQNATIAGSVEQMSVATADIASKSVEAATVSARAGQNARGGSDAVEQTVEGIRSVATLIRETSAVVQQLGDRGQTIGKIIEVINDIADQTNLLALNAAIEAARAGEHGRGFAVVADEVRKLADRTTKATAEVAQSIREIQSDTSSVVERIAQTATGAEQGVRLAEQTGKVLTEIMSDTDRVASMIQSIAAATEEQTAASSSVRQNVTAIETSSQEATGAASETAKAAATLYDLSRELQGLVGGFRIVRPKHKV